ncbi:uncharacterized protein LOC128317263 [Pangasianodon hypophthalmus]|uniref:uncharacterized protein LOC128317263 n=1 Tax=Pangasianodon hypophthalmus TaxID=310915 RepID=UPI000EFFB31A|nr:uncharacterized protein LOC128317263 [Pangasianodon hypophthalmus]
MDPAGGRALRETGADVETVYVEYRPPARDFFDPPRAPLYAAMGAALVLVVAYAIVGHLIKDLMHECLDYTLGPQEEDLKENSEGDMASPSHVPTPLPLSHPNAFHLWDQDDVVIPLSPKESPQSSPLLTVIPHFFNSPPVPHALLPHALLPHTLLPHTLLPHTLLPHVLVPHSHSPQSQSHTPRSHSPQPPEVLSPTKMPPDTFF